MELWRELGRVRVGTTVPSPNLGEEDLRLILAWGGFRESSTEITASVARKLLGDFEFSRLWSARAAELAANKYYTEIGNRVNDVAITQLDPTATAWRTHDLAVDGTPIDVKNARQCSARADRYSEFLVPRFKHDRLSQRSVTIAAVFSEPYRSASSIEEGKPARNLVLGEVTQDDLKQLAKWINANFDGIVKASDLTGNATLPGWCFDYSVVGQGLTADIGQKVGTYLAFLADHSEIIEDVRPPKLLAAYCADESVVREIYSREASGRGGDADLSLWTAFSAMRSNIGFSRRSLFLFVLAYTLVQARTQATDWSPSVFRDWFFWDRIPNHQCLPLGLYDPLAYVHEIVEAMVVLWDTARADLAQYDHFQLAGPSILRGRAPSGRLSTLMAYCGGWHIAGGYKMKCGQSPLLLGMHEQCATCTRLICDVCGYCSESCGARH